MVMHHSTYQRSPDSANNVELNIMNRLLLVMRSMANKSIELSRGLRVTQDYGDCKARLGCGAV